MGDTLWVDCPIQPAGWDLSTFEGEVSLVGAGRGRLPLPPSLPIRYFTGVGGPHTYPPDFSAVEGDSTA